MTFLDEVEGRRTFTPLCGVSLGMLLYSLSSSLVVVFLILVFPLLLTFLELQSL